MGFLKKVGKTISKAVKTVSKGVDNIVTDIIGNTIKDPIGNIGKMVNDITGVTSSARQQAEAQKELQSMAQDYNTKEAQVERDWQEEMSNTARQRAVEDSQKAGVNPILAAGGTAAGASAGAGATATSSTGQAGTGVGSNPISMITELIKAANNTAKTNAEVKNINADTKLKGQEHNNGGRGGTGVTRTIDWLGNKINQKTNTARQKAEDAKQHGFNPFNKNSAWYN